MTKPVFYSISKETLALAQSELDQVRQGKVEMGGRLRGYLAERHVALTTGTTAYEYLSYLMGTRSSCIFAESDVAGDGSDWTSVELRLLSRIAVNFTETVAYNDGKWDSCRNKIWTDYPSPMPIQVACVSGTLLRNGMGQDPLDRSELLDNKGAISLEKLIAHYEQKLLPVLLMHNEVARANNNRLVVNIPGIGTGQFVTDALRSELKKLLPQAILRIIQKHADRLTHIHTINYDPFSPQGLESGLRLDHDVKGSTSDTCINFQIRPFIHEGKGKAQLDFPENITPQMVQEQQLKLLKIVAWDPCSFVMNDMWGDRRTTDEATAASTSILAEAIKAKHLVMTTVDGEFLKSITFKYNPELGCQSAYVKDESMRHSLFRGVAQLETVSTPEDFVMVDFENYQFVANPVPKQPNNSVPVPVPGANLFDRGQTQTLRQELLGNGEGDVRGSDLSLEQLENDLFNPRTSASGEAQQRGVAMARFFNPRLIDLIHYIRTIRPEGSEKCRTYTSLLHGLYDTKNRYIKDHAFNVDGFKSCCKNMIEEVLRSNDIEHHTTLQKILRALLSAVAAIVTFGIAPIYKGTFWVVEPLTADERSLVDLKQTVNGVSS
jgi:hypothetical protein